jgi:hypothetical protein
VNPVAVVLKIIVVLAEILEAQLLEPVGQAILKQVLPVVRNIDTALLVYVIPQAGELGIRDLEFLAQGYGLGKKR